MEKAENKQIIIDMDTLAVKDMIADGIKRLEQDMIKHIEHRFKDISHVMTEHNRLQIASQINDRCWMVLLMILSLIAGVFLTFAMFGWFVQ